MAISFNNGTVLTSGGGSSNLLVNADGDAVLAGIPLINQGRRHYYVNAVGGSDSNDGLTSGTAYKTIQHAVDQIADINQVAESAGQFHNIIHLASGTYGENVKILSKEFNGSKSNLLLLLQGERQVLDVATIVSRSNIDPDAGVVGGAYVLTASLQNSYAVDELKGCHFELGTTGLEAVIISNSGSVIQYISPSRTTIHAFNLGLENKINIYRNTATVSGSIKTSGNNGVIAAKNLKFIFPAGNAIDGVDYPYGVVPEEIALEQDYYSLTNTSTGSLSSATLASSFNIDRLLFTECDFSVLAGTSLNAGINSHYVNCYFSGTNSILASTTVNGTYITIQGCFIEGTVFSITGVTNASLATSYVKDASVVFTQVPNATPPAIMKTTGSVRTLTFTNSSHVGGAAPILIRAGISATNSYLNIGAAIISGSGLVATNSYVNMGAISFKGPWAARPLQCNANSTIRSTSAWSMSGTLEADHLIIVQGNSTFAQDSGQPTFNVDLRYPVGYIEPTFYAIGSKILFSSNSMPIYSASCYTSSVHDVKLDDVPFKWSDLPVSNFYSTAHYAGNISNNYIKYNLNPFGWASGIGGTANSQFELGSTEGRKVTYISTTSANLNTYSKSIHASNIFCDIQSAGNCTITLPTISGSSAVSSSLHRQYTIKNYSGNRTVTLSSSNGDFIETNTIAASGTLRIHALSSSARGYGWYAI